MWPVTQRFIDTLSHSYERRAYVEVLQDGVVITTLDAFTMPDPVTGSLVQSIGGSVSVDRRAVRRSGVINFADISPDANPSEVLDLLQPLVTEIRPWVGVKYWDATQVEADPWEYVPLGTLVVAAVDTSSYPQVGVQGYDRMWMVGPFTAALSIPSGTVVSDAMSL